MDVAIDTTGTPTAVEILVSSGSAEIDSVSLLLAKESRFSVPTWDGRPVPVRFPHFVFLPDAPSADSAESVEHRHEGPELLNWAEIQHDLDFAATELSVDLGKRAALLTLYVDGTGTTRRMLLSERTCWEALDSAILDVAERMRFSPARVDGEAVGTWINQPVTVRWPR